MVMRRLMKELAELQTSPPEGIRVVTNENNMLDVTGIIEGPGTLPLSCLGRWRRLRHAQRAPLTRVAILASSSASQRSFLLLHQNVRIYVLWFIWMLMRWYTGWFATKIFHPNVGPAGEICVNTLKKDWKSSYGIGHILVTVKCLLIYPNPESALDEEAGRLLLENYDDYCSRAKLMTSVHATPRVRT